jgi:hypothetical protein
MALIDHDLHAIAAAALVAVTEEFDVMRCNGGHDESSAIKWLYHTRRVNREPCAVAAAGTLARYFFAAL